MLEQIDDNLIQSWYRKNYFESDETSVEKILTNHLNLTDQDIEKFTPKKKAKKAKKKNLDEFLEDKESEDSTDK